MALSIEEILGFVPLTKQIETVKSGTPRPLPPAFYARKPEFRLLGDKTRRVETAGTRKAARLVPYGASGRQIDHLPLSQRDIRLIHTEERVKFSTELFLQIRDFENYTVMVKMLEEARRQVAQTATRQTVLETTAVHTMLANGYLYFDSSGEILTSSSGAQDTIDYGVPANNKNQLNGIIDAPWSLPTTDIPKHLQNIKLQARFNTGYPLKYALYGKNIMSYLLKNDFVAKYMTSLGGADYAKSFLSMNEIPDGLFGMTWIPMYEAFHDTGAGALAEEWPADGITFCPDPADGNVYGIYEGSTPVPKNFSFSSDVLQQWSNWDHAYGMYGYGYPEWNPLGLVGVYGDTFLPSLMNPSAYFLADTTF